MAKIHSTIGFVQTVEVSPGVWEEQIAERPYYGNLTRNVRKWNSSETLNDDLTLTNTVSILADSFAYQNYSAMRYIVLSNSKWKITSIDIQYPRLILTIGGVYNG
jgi:hypothetical protein